MNAFLLVAIKLLIGFFSMAIIINLSGKGNLAPSSASDQIVNYVLGVNVNIKMYKKWKIKMYNLGSTIHQLSYHQ